MPKDSQYTVRAVDVPAALARAYQVATHRPYGPVQLSVPGDDWDCGFRRPSGPCADAVGKASVTGRYVEEPGDLEPALAGAIASDEPILLHVRVARTEEYPY